LLFDRGLFSLIFTVIILNKIIVGVKDKVAQSIGDIWGMYIFVLDEMQQLELDNVTR